MSKSAESAAKRLIELAGKATPGPWEWWYEDKEQSDIVRTSNNGQQHEENIICRDAGVYPPNVPTCEFIIASRTLAPKIAEALLVAMDALNSVLMYRNAANEPSALNLRVGFALDQIEKLFAEGE